MMFFRSIFVALILGLTTLPALAQDFGSTLASAEQAMRVNQFDRAAQIGRQAWQKARSKPDKVRAARLIAAAHFRAGQYFRAEYWLRLAANAAPDPFTKQAIAADFRGLRAISPWNLQIDISAAPNSNVNNGSQAETVTIWGLPFVLNADARALAGYEFSLGARLAYRISESPRHRTNIGLTASARTFTLSPSAAKAAPFVKGSDYAFSGAELFLTHEFRHNLANGPALLSAHFGRNWYGGAPFSRFARLTFGQTFIVSPTNSLGLTVGLERQDVQRTNSLNNVVMLSGFWGTKLANNDALTITASHNTTISKNSHEENEASRLGVRYALARPIWGANLAFGADVEYRNWDVSIFDLANGRQDTSVNLVADIKLNELDAYGFAPVIRLEARQTDSNIGLFDRQSFGIRFGLQTKF